MSVRLSDTVTALTPMGEVLFSAGDRNKLMRMSGFAAGKHWISTWLPKRWDYSYALALGWRQKPPRDTGLIVRKSPDNLPFYETGEMIQKANQAAPKVSATKGRVTMTVTVPIGHGLDPRIAAPFRRVPAHEIQDTANAFRAAFLDLLNQGTETISKGRGIGRQRLSASARAAAKSSQYNRWGYKKNQMPPTNAGLQSRAADLRGQRAAFNAQRQKQSDFYADGIDAMRSDPHRAARIRSDNAGRQRRWRHRDRARKAAYYSHL